MDEISMLRETFEPDATPSAAAQQRARQALLDRIDPPARPRFRLRMPITVGVVSAAAVVAALVVANLNGARPAVTPARPQAQPQTHGTTAKLSIPYLKPVSAAQYLENAAFVVEQEQWVDPAPTQFMYVETLEMRNPRSLEQKMPNGALVPGKAAYRKIQAWDRVDGQVQGRIVDGKLQVHKQGDNDEWWGRLAWSQITPLTTPEAVAHYVVDPGGPYGVDVDALSGQYVMPPKVRAAIYRYLAQQPGMKVNPDAVNLDGHPAIGLGRILEGYLSQELLFDKKTYTLIGERMVAVKDQVNRGDDGTSYTHKGDLFRQVIYRKLVIVDKPGQTS
jgi:hypothetical protein